MKKLIVTLLSLFTVHYTLLASVSFAQVDLGKIAPPPGTVPDAGADPSGFVATLVRNSLTLLLIVSFVIALIWMIINGLRFILAQGDEKTISSAWSHIYWTLIGMAVIMGSFAIIKIVETFFQVTIISGDFRLPGL